MADNQRKDTRVPLLVEVLWEGAAGKYEARTSDVSLGGCFIDTIGQMAIGETISFRLCLPAGEWIELQGEVMYELPRAGFGVRFVNLSDDQRYRLEAVIKAQDQ
ncbi:MAG: PilZ domain-containing protein [Acidobacteriota bacterium]|nr:PilZ domain-containing protein [Acidobacteriota bacterium]